MLSKELISMPDSFKNRFIEAKEIRNVRWIDIANKSGLDKASISQYKNGVHIPEQDALYKLATALNVNIEWLMGHDVPMENIHSIDEKETLRHYLKSLGYEIMFVSAEMVDGILMEINHSENEILPLNKRRLPKITKGNNSIILTEEEYSKLQDNIQNIANYELDKLFKEKGGKKFE